MKDLTSMLFKREPSYSKAERIAFQIECMNGSGKMHRWKEFHNFFMKLKNVICDNSRVKRRGIAQVNDKEGICIASRIK